MFIGICVAITNSFLDGRTLN